MTLVGHAVSAMIGMLASIIAPEKFAPNIMVAPSACYIDHPGCRGGFSPDDIRDLLDTMDSNYLGRSSTMVPLIMGAPGQPELGQERANSFCRTDPAIARHFARVTFMSDHRADVLRLAAPTLVPQCTDDIVAPPEVGAFIHQALPDSELVMIANTGHCPHLSEPADSIAAILAFFTGHG